MRSHHHHDATPSRHVCVSVTLLLVLVTAAVTQVMAAPSIPPPPREDRHLGCIHDKMEHQRRHLGPLPRVSYSSPSASSASPSAEMSWQPLRIRFFTHDLTHAQHACTAAGQSRSDLAGQHVRCTADDAPASPSAIAALTDVLLPALAQQYAARLSVQRATDAELLSGGHDGQPTARARMVVPSLQHVSVCREFTVPPAHQQTGVANADMVMYVTSAPMPSGVSAWAMTCAEEAHMNNINNNNVNNAPLGRPAVAVMAISSHALAQLTASVQSNDNNNNNTQQINEGAQAILMDAMSHAMLHALGFSTMRFRAHDMLHYVSHIRGKPGPLPVLQSPAVVAAAQAHFGCPSLSFMELEDAADSAAVSAHWKLRNARDELMSSSPPSYRTGNTLNAAAAAAPHSPRYLTALSLAALEDLGYYRANYEAAEVSQWGRDAGCAMVNEPCRAPQAAAAAAKGVQRTNHAGTNADNDVRALGGRAAGLQEFCLIPGQASCTPNHTAMQSCSLFSHRDDLPMHFRYFGQNEPRLAGGSALMDYCPERSNLLSSSTTSCIDDTEANALSTSGIDSRCFDISTLSLGSIGLPLTALCANVNCNAATYTYTVQLRGDTMYRDCTQGGVLNVNLLGLQVGLITVQCPPYSVICTKINNRIPSGGTPIR